MRSRRLKFDFVDLKKTVRDLVFVAVGSALTYASTELIPQLEQSDIPLVTTVGVPFLTAVIAGLWRYIRDNQSST